jgi:phosphonate transport system permease protein
MSGSGRDLDHLSNLRRFLSQFFPPDFSVTPQIMSSLGETIQIAVMATFFASVISIPLAIAGAQNIAPRWMNIGTRMILNVIRTLPSLIWALLAVAVVGPNPLAGVIGLTFYSIGYLGKFFSDAFESIDTEVPDALRLSGADAIQAFQYGLLPQVKPLILSHVLWMLEYNIRSAAIVGYVGAGGIGLLLHTYQEFGHWDRFSTVLVFILALVTMLDFFGEWLRGRIVRSG